MKDAIKEIREKVEELEEAEKLPAKLYVELCDLINHQLHKDMEDRGIKDLQFEIGPEVDGGFMAVDVYNCKEFTGEWYEDFFENYTFELEGKIFKERKYMITFYTNSKSKAEKYLT